MKKISANEMRLKRKKRIRSKVFGTGKKPRLCVFRSLKSVYVQVVDDYFKKTIISANLKNLKKFKNNVEGAKELGKLIAKKCQDNKIKEVVFDRGGYQYHGKIKALADGIREGGIKF
jgi:large subunit ribosomal protein L18